MTEPQNRARRPSECDTCGPLAGSDAEIARHSRELPMTLAPTRDLWPGIEAQIAERSPIKGHIGPASPDGTGEPATRETGPGWGWAIGFAVAAGLTGIIAGSLLIGPATGGGDAPLAGGSGTPEASSPAVESAAIPVSFGESQVRAVEAAYEPELRALRQLVDATDLAPETRDALASSLETIDQAIEEAREALLADPGTPRAVDALRGMYDAKIDLLHHVATRPGRT